MLVVVFVLSSHGTWQHNTRQWCDISQTMQVQHKAKTWCKEENWWHGAIWQWDETWQLDAAQCDMTIWWDMTKRCSAMMQQPTKQCGRIKRLSAMRGDAKWEVKWNERAKMCKRGGGGWYYGGPDSKNYINMCQCNIPARRRHVTDISPTCRQHSQLTRFWVATLTSLTLSWLLGIPY